ncbi:MAG TPA: DUF1510 family protein [Bacillus sp. (in: firmicutes)]|uniref:DUF1510 family protein n=1 Tax=Bacillus litorisediminis TaxID=2922713 RepID=UPI001FAD2155|nr:DUF1510 family protein [Bacillus litorisediminis]HWO74742.1 DUF1510 family protein [Bacillus sp. (in: firmicutes)]
MKNDYKDFYIGSRAQTRSKKRKTNLILNSLIGIVVLLIVIVGANIFFGSDNDEAALEATNPQNNSENIDGSPADEEAGDETGEDTEEPAEEETESPDSNEAGDEGTDPSEEPSEEGETDLPQENQTIVEDSNDPNVKETYVNPGWQPIGTQQQGEHTKNFSTGSQDWAEMQQAIAVALNTSTAGLTYWCVENGGGEQVIGTVTTKGGASEPYRVYIEWVDGQGWKPVKVQSLVENDKQNSCG